MLELCPGTPEHRSPVAPALTSLAIMLFDPNGAGKDLVGPLHAKYGATIFGPGQSSQNFKCAWCLHIASSGEALCMGSHSCRGA